MLSMLTGDQKGEIIWTKFHTNCNRIHNKVLLFYLAASMKGAVSGKQIQL